MRKEISIPEEVIMNKILVIRAKKVIIGFVRTLRGRYQATQRTGKEEYKTFPREFYVPVDPGGKRPGGRKLRPPPKFEVLTVLPYVFTEHGTMMAANILNSDKAIGVSVRIIETYVKMREMLTDNLSVKLEIEEIKKKLSK